MLNVELSESAVAVLRFEIKGYRPKEVGRRLPAYLELAAVGIMEPVPGSDVEHRFTAFGLEHREEILEREAERIERRRLDPPADDLSEAARERLRRHLAGDRAVTEERLPAYRELVAARVMIPSHPFAGGRITGSRIGDGGGGSSWRESLARSNPRDRLRSRP